MKLFPNMNGMNWPVREIPNPCWICVKLWLEQEINKYIIVFRWVFSTQSRRVCFVAIASRLSMTFVCTYHIPVTRSVYLCIEHRSIDPIGYRYANDTLVSMWHVRNDINVTFCDTSRTIEQYCGHVTKESKINIGFNRDYSYEFCVTNKAHR